MKKFFSCLLLTAVCWLLTTPSATAQQFNRRKLYNTVSVHLNAMNYFGDIVPKTSFASLRLGATRPNLAVSYMHRFAPRLSGRVALSYGRISGSDNLAADVSDNDASYRYYRNLSFRNDIVELSGVAVIDLFENRGTYLKRREFAPYLFGGLALFHHNPKAELDGKYVALQPLGTEGQAAGYDSRKKYKRGQISIPFGAGIRYKLDRQIDLGFEIGWRKTFTDYLDDVSKTYADPALLSAQARLLADRSNEKGQISALSGAEQIKYSGYGVKDSKRGTDNENDWYIVSGFNISYILTPTQKSPKFR
jgi:Domain of unknown function (DUF6089)